MEFELTAPAEFADWSAAAENLAEQLTDFGIKTTFRGVNFTAAPCRHEYRQLRNGHPRMGRGQPASALLV